MATATIDEERLKELFKSAFAEALREQRELVQEIVEEALEDIALSRAIGHALDGMSETVLLSEQALAEDWNRPEEDEAWSHLQQAR